MAERGSLQTYLGTAPGVGNTYAVLAAARGRQGDGEHVVVGWVERKGRNATREQLGELEVIPPREFLYRDVGFPELDTAAVIASGAGVAVVDELAHLLPEASAERFQDVEQLLDAGIDVMTTLNVSNLDSVRGAPHRRRRPRVGPGRHRPQR